jgi:hypothetical protein
MERQRDQFKMELHDEQRLRASASATLVGGAGVGGGGAPHASGPGLVRSHQQPRQPAVSSRPRSVESNWRLSSAQALERAVAHLKKRHRGSGGAPELTALLEHSRAELIDLARGDHPAGTGGASLYPHAPHPPVMA